MNNRFITTTKAKPADTSIYSVCILASIPQERMLYSPPISLYPIDSYNTVLSYQYKTIRSVFPKSNIFLVVGHNAHQVIPKCPKDVHIIENQKYTEFGEAEEIKIAINATITESVILISGNMVFDDKTLAQIKTSHSSVLVDKRTEDDGAIGIIENNSKLENMAFGLSNKWCYISHFNGKELDILRNVCNTKTKSNLCNFEVINTVINRNGIIYTVQRGDGFIQRIHK